MAKTSSTPPTFTEEQKREFVDNMESFLKCLETMAITPPTEVQIRELWDKMEPFLNGNDFIELERDQDLANKIASLDNQLYKEQLPKTVIGEAVKRWLEKEKNVNPETKSHLHKSSFMYKLVKLLVKNGADFIRSLKVASKESRTVSLMFMLRLIVDDGEKCNWSPSDDKKRDDFLEEAVKNFKFISAINDVYKYKCLKQNLDNLDDLKKMDTNLEWRRYQANPYVFCLLFLLKTSYFVDERGEKGDGLETCVILEALKCSCELRNQTNSYLTTDFKHLSNQVENFAVELIDEVQDSKELDLVMEMKDRRDILLLTGTEMNKITLLQHAINLSCKSFVASKKCQYLMEKIVFGRNFQFWNAEKAGVLKLLLILSKIVLGVIFGVGLVFSHLILKPIWCIFCKIKDKKCTTKDNSAQPDETKRYTYRMNEIPYGTIPNTSDKTTDRADESDEISDPADGFSEFLELPCQIYLFDLCWYACFLGLIIRTAFEENFGPNNIHLYYGLTISDFMVYIYAVLHVLRSLVNFLHRVSIVLKNSKTYLNWRFVLPEVISFVDISYCLFIVIAISIWINQWEKNRAWEPRNQTFRNEDILYSVASLLAFTRLAHFYKAQQDIGKLVYSMYLMLIRDVVFFTFIFVSILFLPFAIGLRKMYSYYKTDESTRNETQQLASIGIVFGVLFWTMMGTDERSKLEVTDPDYEIVKTVGVAFLGAFVVTSVLVAVNMLIAMMNQTYEQIVINVDEEYVFYRTRMWLEYIAKDYVFLPRPLNVVHAIKMLVIHSKDIVMASRKRSCRRSNMSPRTEKDKNNKRTSLQERLVIRYLWRSLGLKEDDVTFDNNWPTTTTQNPQNTPPAHGTPTLNSLPPQQSQRTASQPANQYGATAGVSDSGSPNSVVFSKSANSPSVHLNLSTEA